MACSHFNENSLLVKIVPCNKQKGMHFNREKPMFMLKNFIPPFPSMHIKDVRVRGD